MKKLIFKIVRTDQKCPDCGEVFRALLHETPSSLVFYCQKCDNYFGCDREEPMKMIYLKKGEVE